MIRSWRMCTWNVQGLEKKGQELQFLVVNHDIDICLLSETKLAPDTPFSVQGYKLHRACHPYDLRRGGSAVLIKDTIDCKMLGEIVINCDHNLDRGKRFMACLQVARIQLKLFDDETYQIGAFYAPSGHALMPGNFSWVFQQMGSHFLLGGDFNGHHKSWNGGGSLNLAGRRLNKVIIDENMEIMAPTFYTNIPNQTGQKPSILDFFVGKNVKFMSNIPKVFQDCTSDHKPVLMTLEHRDLTTANISASTSVHRRITVGSPSPFSNSNRLSVLIPPAVAPLTVQSNTGTLSGPGQSSTSQTQNSVLQPFVDASTPTNVLRVSTWDPQGLAGKEHEIFQYIEDMDILMISNSHIFPESLEIPEFKIYTADHPTSSIKGGSALLIRESLDHYQMPSINEEFAQIARVMVRIDCKEFQFGSVYLSPEYDNLPCEHYVDVFEELLNSSGFIVGGGFNAKHAHWNCTDDNNRGNRLFQLINLFQLEVLVPSLPTFYPGTGSKAEILDFFIGKCFPNVDKPPRPLCNSHSEHKPVYVRLRA